MGESTGGPSVEPEIRRARWATAGLFLSNGALFAALVPRYPEIKADLGLSNAALGVTVAAFSAGALAVGPLAGAGVRQVGSARLAVAGTARPRWFPPPCTPQTSCRGCGPAPV